MDTFLLPVIVSVVVLAVLLLASMSIPDFHDQWHEPHDEIFGGKPMWGLPPNPRVQRTRTTGRLKAKKSARR